MKIELTPMQVCALQIILMRESAKTREDLQKCIDAKVYGGVELFKAKLEVIFGILKEITP